MDQCEECRFQYASVDPTSIPERLRTLSRRYGAPLSRFLPGEDGRELVRRHPVAGAWSALEYACHVRDVLLVLPARAEQAVAEDRPRWEPMRRDERVVELAYDQQDPLETAEAIAVNGDAAADVFEGLDAAHWQRTGIASYPVEAERSLVWLGQHTVHELHHHLLDVGRTLRAARGR